jgi:predicted TIM-barrel fold metal-dependent hydrolase
MIKLFNVILLLLLFCTIVIAQQKVKTDHHVHIFSKELVKYLKSQRLLGNSFDKEDEHYTNINLILRQTDAENIWLISTGYAFIKSQILEEEINFQLNEHQHLHNAALKFPQKIKPFYGINPLKPYALQLIKRAHKHLIFQGIKLHFQSAQIEFRNKTHVNRLKEVFAYTGQHKIPVILHFQNHKNGITNTDIQFFFSSIIPSQYKHKLIFAHLGSAGWLKQNDLDNAKLLKSLADDNPHIQIKFDISGIIHPNFYNEDLASYGQLTELINYIGYEHILYGSDYPLYSSKEYLKVLQNSISLNRKQWKKLLRTSW